MSLNAELGRIPVQIIEIDQDYCGNTYGVAPCTANQASKCYHGYANCQDQANFNQQSLTLRFAKSHTDLPDEEYIIPSLKSVSTNATKLNIGGRSNDTKPLGKRASVSISLQDHPHSDNVVDPYVDERPYNPLENGTFWGKWMKRNPYYTGRNLRVLDGYYGQTLAEMQTRHYVIDSISLPDSKGNVSIKAQDILRLADNDKAQAPALSTGKLLTDITNTATTFTVTGDVASSYAQGGTNIIRINDELIQYVSITTLANGDLTFNTVTRAFAGTEAQAHDADDSVQGCLQYDNIRPDNIAKDLLLNYGNIDTAYINATDWSAEGTTWYGSIDGTRIISEPTGVTELLGELCEQFMFFIWWDELDQLIRFKAIAPEFNTPVLLDEENNFLQNKTALKTDSDMRTSEIWVSYLPKTPIEDLDKRDSYRRTLARVDPSSASTLEYGERKVYEIMSGWLDNDTQVSLLASRLLGRYRDNVTILSFSLDAKDRGLEVADLCDIRFKSLVDITGAPETVRYQIISKNEKVPSEVIEYTAIKFEFAIGFKAALWMASDAPLYSSATDEQKATGAWWSDTEGLISGDDGYVWS